MDLLNDTVLLKTKSTLFNLLIRETSHFLCYEKLLNMTYVAYKNAFFREMQFWSHCYTVVSYQSLFRLSVYKIPAVYLSGAKNVCFCTIRDFGSPTIVRKCIVCIANNINRNVYMYLKPTRRNWFIPRKATKSLCVLSVYCIGMTLHLGCSIIFTAHIKCTYTRRVRKWIIAS